MRNDCNRYFTNIWIRYLVEEYCSLLYIGGRFGSGHGLINVLFHALSRRFQLGFLLTARGEIRHLNEYYCSQMNSIHSFIHCQLCQRCHTQQVSQGFEYTSSFISMKIFFETSYTIVIKLTGSMHHAHSGPFWMHWPHDVASTHSSSTRAANDTERDYCNYRIQSITVPANKSSETSSVLISIDFSSVRFLLLGSCLADSVWAPEENEIEGNGWWRSLSIHSRVEERLGEWERHR